MNKNKMKNSRQRCQVKRVKQNGKRLARGVQALNGLVLNFVPNLLLGFLYLRSVNGIDPEWFSAIVPYILGQTFFSSSTQSSLLQPASEACCCRSCSRAHDGGDRRCYGRQRRR